MATANEILNFNFHYSALQVAANNIIPQTFVQLFEQSINKLKKIREDIGEKSFKFKSENLIPQVFKKFNNTISKSTLQPITVDIFDKRELKALSYCLSYSELNKPSIFSSFNNLNVGLNTLEKNWKDTFLFGLIRCYLENWQSPEITSLVCLHKFIVEKLQQYNGGRSILNSFKKNIKFFDIKNGDVVLGNELALNGMQIKEATKYLLLPDSWFAYPFFSKVIVAYYDKRKLDIPNFIDDLDIALNEHNNIISNKRLISKLIIQTNAKEFLGMQDKVKRIAFRLVGDPGNAANWIAFDNSTAHEIEDLGKARKFLNEWITRQFITVFFEKCINDTRRKQFWLQYAKEIKQFRVVGSTYIKDLLLADNRIKDYVEPRFSNTNSSSDSNAALMFIIKNHLFIEFSDTGAFYAYKLSNPKAPSIESSFFQSTSSLKIPTMNFLAYRTGYLIEKTFDEGRLGHSDGELRWEQVALYWLNHIGKINV